ncbi:MAG: phosphodiesterase, partial [Gammaproteobacteria bacterium]|nr:phosphodiesterase [Gammaproteobacteria bacterium]
MASIDNDFLFQDEHEESEETATSSSETPWKILIVDDEKDVHEVTKMALSGFVFKNRELTYLHAYSAQEGKALVRNHSDIALAIVDVVMETETSGLELVYFIRQTLKNRLIRLILRT